MAEFTDDQREKLAEKKQAMPDGSYPIRNRKDLKNAIQAYGRSKNKQKTKAWIKKRARELKAEDLLPDEWTEEVWHYGIKGQKWGIRRFQDEDGTLTSAGKKRYSESGKAEKKADKKDSKQKIDEESKKKKWSTGKKIAVAAAALVAAYAAYKFVDSGRAKQLIDKGRSFLLNQDISFKKDSTLAKLTDKNDIFSKVVSKVNPNYGELGTVNNCRRCTIAYEMRRRGFDVKATRTMGGTGQNAIGLYSATHKNTTINGVMGWALHNAKQVLDGEVTPDKTPYALKWFRDMSQNMIDIKEFSVEKSIHNASKVFTELSKQADGARGEIELRWYSGGAHSIAWEIIKGSPVMFDCQTGIMYDSPKDFNTLSMWASGISYSRLDNVDFNIDFLLRWLENA